MVDKDQLVNDIKEWIQIDNELKELQKAARERRQRKKELTSSLVEVMKSNEIDCFDTNDGKLIYSQTKTKQSVSKKYLLTTLHNFYKDEPETAKMVTEYILTNRPEKINENVRRKLT